MESLDTLVQRWLEWDQDPSSRKEIEKLQADKDDAGLEKRLRERIQFGTAGLRGRMQAGFSCMNSLTVIQASQGLAKFIKAAHAGAEQPSVVIGHDARHNSQKFAFLAANAFEAEGIHVWWYDSVNPTPFVPFAVLLKKANAGVMVTASHVSISFFRELKGRGYFSNGAQINSPIDGRIAESISVNLVPWANAWRGIDGPQTRESDLHTEVLALYCEAVNRFAKSTVDTWRLPSKFVYTPMHGVGHATMSKLCDSLGIQGIITVSEQEQPDPDFSTVKFPNPEENGALDLAMKTADKAGVTLIVANDPDADRFAAAEKINGSWFRFTGDQIGVLLASHLLDSWKKEKTKKPMAMLNSAVSSNMLSKMAEKEGFHFEETLTGFKWMGNVARQLETQGYEVPFAFEEALGYMFTKVCYDKDGLTAAMVFLAAEAKWKEQGLTPFGKLEQLYETYGYHENLNTYFVSPSTESTTSLFESIRRNTLDVKGTIGSFPINRWRDMTRGFDSDTADKRPALPVDPASQMLTIWSHRGVRFTIRGSGTEPKVKIYIESCGASRNDAVEAVCNLLTAVLENWIKPFAPAMTYFNSMTTSSGHILKLA
ncbi:phosphoglucomutase-2 [Nannizzia gypsea CBS 118893]|uniref:Phosphoglucomutase-2 n=1 Tax=Arthroderma gypseum (strain ATCC MYA-4604 / CBS 118893) TaxID=535722 RepID=E4UXK4_ARTGP|nr:phosphoglucomutase-2 [Nannizzia gypsea CBS 118893]EFR02738.1 phosphoglucomutase-2 [Nannizzia gypsea CBS 118893]